MRDILRNPMFYYVVAPVLVGIWPLLVWGVYLPQAQQAWEDDKAYYFEGQTYMVDVLLKDPDRLDIAGNDQVTGEFSYAAAIERVANLYNIPDSSCTYSAGRIITSQNRRTQQCKVTLENVGIVQAASFLSKIQSTWVNLDCDKVKLERREKLPDRWKVSLTFYYHY